MTEITTAPIRYWREGRLIIVEQNKHRIVMEIEQADSLARGIIIQSEKYKRNAAPTQTSRTPRG